MSALSLATLGVQCPGNRALSMASLGVFCVRVEFGGRQFLVFKPLTDLIEHQLPVGTEVIKQASGVETELIIDGEKYEFVAKRTPKQILYEYPKLDDLLDEAVEKMGITRRKAKKELYNRVIEALNKAESVKESVFVDDEQIIMILVASDDI